VTAATGFWRIASQSSRLKSLEGMGTSGCFTPKFLLWSDSIVDPKVKAQLKTASREVLAMGRSKTFSCNICGNDWDRFIEKWASVAYYFVGEAFGGYHTEPMSEIVAMPDAQHTAGANASFNIMTGQVSLCASVVDGRPGITLEKLVHEFTHGALAGFPEGDPFTEEGYVDYSVWVMAHAPIWNPWQQDMIAAANYNIQCRRERALANQSDYDRKRWAGGVFASEALGPWIVSYLKMKKAEGNLTW